LSIFKSFAIPKKSICVGNLSVGGTGKTPHVAYIVNLIYKKHSTTILSRGYGRKTKLLGVIFHCSAQLVSKVV